MVYEWDHHKDVCYDLYIVQRKSLEEIMAYMRNELNFTPSKRAYQVQFKRWDFPSKQNPAHRNTELVARIKELWEQNLSQRQMLATLHQDGYVLKERELMRVRAKNRWLLRVPNGMKDKLDDMNEQAEDMTQEEFDNLQAQLETSAGIVAATPRKVAAAPPPLPEEEVERRKRRHEELLDDSEKRMATKKRRRRTKEWAGLPADPEGAPPRFPSETTLEEGKVYLDLSNEKYKEMRDQFQGICESVGLVKKTVAGPEKWAAAKDRLVRENVELQKVFWNETQYSKESKNLALDVICTDVTKRMRTMETRMTIADAKNTLGINPEQSRQLRNAFYNILKADHFESKLAAGQEHWKELKDKWIGSQPLLQQILEPGDADPAHGSKQKALEVLARDVMKRLRDDGVRGTGPETNDESNMQPSPEPDSVQRSPITRRVPPAPATAAAAVAAAATQLADSSLQLSNLDPSLLTTSDTGPQHEQSQLPLEALSPFLRQPTPIYIRPHALSNLPLGAPASLKKMFLASLSSPTIPALVNLISDHWPGCAIERIDGVEKSASIGGQEMKYLIEDDEELEAYLEHTKGKKSAFSVFLSAKQ